MCFSVNTAIWDRRHEKCSRKSNINKNMDLLCIKFEMGASTSSVNPSQDYIFYNRQNFRDTLLLHQGPLRHAWMSMSKKKSHPS